MKVQNLKKKTVVYLYIVQMFIENFVNRPHTIVEIVTKKYGTLDFLKIFLYLEVIINEPHTINHLINNVNSVLEPYIYNKN